MTSAFTRRAAATSTAALSLLLAAAVVVCGCRGEEPPRRTGQLTAQQELKEYEDYLAENPGDMRVYKGLAQRHMNMSGDRTAALELADRCVRLNPGKAEALLTALEIRAMAGDTDNVRRAQLAEQYVDLQPRDPKGYLLLADALRDRPLKALDALDRGINLLRGLATADGGDDEAALGQLQLQAARAQLLALQERYADANNALVEVLDDPKLAAAGGAGLSELICLATRCAVHLGISDDAERARISLARTRLDAALRDAPGQPDLIREWAWLMLVDDQAGPAAAIGGLTSMLSCTEVPAARMVIYQYLAQAEVMRGQFEVARSHARRALEVDGNDIPTLLMLYQVLIVLGDRSAGAVGERLVRRRVALLQMPLQPATLQAMFRGVMQRHYWLNDMAVASFQHALDIEQGCSWAALALAQMAQDAADYSRAIIWYRQLLKEDEFAPEAHSSIADCYMALGDYRNAIVHYNDALALVRHYPRARLGKERAETLRDARDARDARDTSQPQ